MNDIQQMAQAIITAHQPRFGDAQPQLDAPMAFTSTAPVYQAAKQASAALGFIEADAQCLALAWQAQSERTGAFDAMAWPCEPQDFGMGDFPPATRERGFARSPDRLGLYAVLPDAAWVGRIARAGVPTVQLRFKSDDAGTIGREVQAAVEAVQGTGALLFINDHWEAAMAAGAYGVHLGQEDLDALGTTQRARLNASGLRLGVSTHGYAEMVRADAVSPSYIAMGAVFPTTLKRMATAPQGLARLHAYARLMRGYSQVAIGGIDAQSLPAVLGSGVGSAAVVRAIVGADDPEAACSRLIEIFEANVRR